MNKTAAVEWLTIASHDLQSARILYEANHYTDSIGSDLQQAIEKILKSMLAFKNQKIPKSHDLYELYVLVEDLTLAEDEIDFLYLSTEYYKEDRYPNPNYSLPDRIEIKQVMNFCEILLDSVSDILKIKKSDLNV